MKKYDVLIIELLLDKFERSKSFTGSNTVKQSFTLDLNKEFPEYADDSKVSAIQAIEIAIGELMEKKLIVPKHRRNGLLYAVSLNAEKTDECYAFLKRKPKKDTDQDLISLYKKYSDGNTVLEKFCVKQIERITNNRKPEHFNGDIHLLENVLKALKEILFVEDETFERDFSVRVLGDSKSFEKIRSTVVSILFEYGDFPDKETVLEDLNIVKNPGHVYFKGKGIISISGQTVDLSVLSGDIAISSSMLEAIDKISVIGNKVITIENLTTFNTFVPEDAFVIYLGGYHNHVRREFIKKLYSQNKGIRYYHYGDIDAGGFYILLHLREKTGINFESFRMDLETLKANIEYTKKLTENDVKRLKNLLGGEFDDVILFMIEHNCKLEQEALDC